MNKWWVSHCFLYVYQRVKHLISRISEGKTLRLHQLVPFQLTAAIHVVAIKDPEGFFPWDFTADAPLKKGNGPETLLYWWIFRFYIYKRFVFLGDMDMVILGSFGLFSRATRIWLASSTKKKGPNSSKFVRQLYPLHKCIRKTSSIC